jgi:hypothetical protein
LQLARGPAFGEAIEIAMSCPACAAPVVASRMTSVPATRTADAPLVHRDLASLILVMPVDGGWHCG